MLFTTLLTAVVSATTVLGAAVPAPGTTPQGQDHTPTVKVVAGDVMSLAAAGGGYKNPTSPPDDPFSTLTEWSGAAIAQDPKSKPRFIRVSAKMKVPTPKLPPGATPQSVYGISAWVGLNGFALTTLLQGGIYMIMDGTGKVLIKAFYQFLPQMEYSDYAKDFDINIGDELYFEVRWGAADHSAVVMVVNTTTRKTFMPPIKVNKGEFISGRTAEWIVERYTKASGAVSEPFDAEFVFTDTVADTNDRKSLRPQDGGVVNYAPNLLPRIDKNKVTVKYVPTKT